MGLFDMFESKSETIKLEDPWQGEGRKGLYDLADPTAQKRLAMAGTPYTGQMTAGMSDPEKTSVDLLSGYLQKDPMDQDYVRNAKSALNETLEGTYDPVSSEYYKAFRSAVMRELGDQVDALSARTSASDRFFGGGRIAEEGDMREGAVNKLTLALADLQNQEQNRKQNAIGQAVSLAGQENQLAQSQIAAAQQYGQLPRLVEQAGLDAEYTEWLRQLADMGVSLDTVMQMLTYKPPTETITKQSGAGALAGAISGGIGAAMGMG